MCNFGFIGRLFPALSRFAALWSLAGLFTFCPPLAAQFAGRWPGMTPRFDEYTFSAGSPDARVEQLSPFDRPYAGPPSEPKVSVDELRHPLTDKARRLLDKALRYAFKGEHLNAIATLREGMAKVPSLVPYAHAVLGVEYVRTGHSDQAVPEFAEAASQFPHDPLMHSNLAVSLCMTGQVDRAEEEARLALYLDPHWHAAQEIVSDIEETKARRAHR